MQRSAIVLNKKDNVATALRQLYKGKSVTAEIGETTINTILCQAIPFGHKYALNNILKGESILKYGEIIGLATQDIEKGCHVHIHNVEGTKGRGDKQ